MHIRDYRIVRYGMPRKGYKSITVKEEIYKALEEIRAIKQQLEGKPVSLQDVIVEILESVKNERKTT